MIKICYVIGTLEIGGAEKQLLLLIKNLDKQRFLPVLIALRDGRMRQDFEEVVEVKVIGKRWKFDPFFIWELTKVIKREKPDILHTFMFTSNTWGRIAGIITGIPVIVASERCVDLWKKWHHKLIDRILLQYTKKIIANSHSVRDFYQKTEKIPDEKIKVVYNGIEFEKIEKVKVDFGKKKRELNLENAKWIVGTGGRFTLQKGFTYLLKAIPDVIKKFPECHFILIGDGFLMNEFKNLVKKSGIEKNVIFTGYRKDILEIFSICDLIVVPSLFEGMPNIVLEAMAIRKPVVGSYIPEIKEIMKDGENGFLVPVKTPDVISEKIIVLLQNTELRKKMGESGYETIKEKFNLKGMVEKYERIYMKLIEKVRKKNGFRVKK